MVQSVCRPWVGADYANQSKRILLVGESAYSTDDWTWHPDANVQLIEDQVVKNPDRALKVMAQVVSNESDPDPKSFWDSVAFANLVSQDIGRGSTSRPTLQAFKESRAGFRTLMDGLLPSPTHIIVFGNLTWNFMPPEQYNNDRFLQGYHFPSGAKALATFTSHPSAKRWGNFDLDAAQQHISEFLRLTFDSIKWRWADEFA